jgi:acyl-CoA hydrolase
MVRRARGVNAVERPAFDYDVRPMVESAALPPSRSATEMTEIVLPQHANVLGTAFGGTVLSWVDVCAAVVAQRHCGRVAVTAAIDEVVFRAPIRVGDVVRLRGRVNAVFRTSIEVEVIVEREDTSLARARCVEARLTFVNVGDDGRPVPVPPLLITTDDERQRESEAKERRAQRLRK